MAHGTVFFSEALSQKLGDGCTVCIFQTSYKHKMCENQASEQHNLVVRRFVGDSSFLPQHACFQFRFSRGEKNSTRSVLVEMNANIYK